MTTFVKRQNEYDAIQFTGGEESAEQVQKWLADRFDGLTTTYQSHSDRKDGSPRGEIVFMRRDLRMNPGDWATKDSWSGRLEILSEDEVSKMFVPLQEFDEAEESFVLAPGQPRYFQKVGSDSQFFERTDEDTLTEIRKDDIEVNGLVWPINETDLSDKDFVKQIRYLSDEAALQFTPNGLEESEHSEAAERLTEINNGIIDSVPNNSEPSMATYLEALRELVELVRDAEHPVVINVYESASAVHRKIIEDVLTGVAAASGETHTEDTLMKARKAIEKLTERQPYTNVRRIVTGVTVDDVIMALQNAGILFRERV